MNTICMIQARMSSTRLPGKVFLPLLDRPVLDWAVSRTRAAETIDSVVVATTTNPADDAIVEHCDAGAMTVFRGPEDDVLSRYEGAADEYGADVVVRVTSDCPFIDPALVDRVVMALRSQGADYASNILAPRTYPRGLDVEAFTADALRVAAAEATRAGWREHVTPFFYRQPDRFALVGIWGEEDHSEHRWTLDTPADLQLLRLIAVELGRSDFAWEEALEAAEAHPEWRAINRDVVQKTID